MRRTEFSHRSLHGAPRGRRWLLIVTILVALVVVVDAISGGTLRSLARSASASVSIGGSRAAGVVLNSGYFTSHRELAAENASLSAQVDSLREQASLAQALRDENEHLRGILGLSSSTPRGITAPIVSSTVASPYGTFLVGTGARDEVSNGDLVLSPAGFVVGRIADVKETTALVSDVFGPRASIDIKVAGAALVAEGHGGGNARASAPRGVEVMVGDIVSAPSYGGRPVGTVGHVESSPTSGDQTLYISVPVNISSLAYVYIVKP